MKPHFLNRLLAWQQALQRVVLSRLPNRCVLCEQPCENGNHPMCGACLEELPYLTHVCCICAEPLAYQGNNTCGHCQKDPPAFSKVVAAVHYQAPCERLITSLKFADKPHLSWSLAYLFAHAQPTEIAKALQDDSVIVPMPMHRNRLVQRGYNQAELIANELHRRFGLQLRTDVCHKIQDTQPQVGMARSQRLRNVRRAFHCSKEVTGKRIVIIDDVLTTGASANALASALLDAGAADVRVWAIARAGAG